MSKELLLVIDAVSNEKGVDKKTIVEAMESALAMATRKKHANNMEVRVEINLKTGEYDTYRQWKVVDDEADIENEDAEICFSDAKKDYPSVKVGDTIEEQMESIEFGRIAAQTAKQVIVQKVRDAERDKILAEFRNRLGTLVMGTVKRVTPEVIFVDLGEHAEGVLPREELISRESFRVNDRVKALLKDIRPERRVGQILLSRTSDEMLGALLRLEVPEVSEEVIEIKAIARDPGSRAKVAVKTNDGRIDPVGACVGMRGSRVQAISNELNGERVDIIAWDNNPAQFVINALAPADIVSIVMDEDTHSMDVAVKEAHLSQAIGKGGQNVRLASRLTGWRLNVIADTAAQEKQNIHAHLIRDKFMRQLNIDENLATLLVEEGFSSIEEVAYVAEEEMLEIFDEATVKHLRENARNALLSMALSGQPAAGDISEEVLALEGVDFALASALASKGVSTLDDLAELSVDDLSDIEGLTPEKAGALIMKAREHWFNNDDQEQNSGHEEK